MSDDATAKGRSHRPANWTPPLRKSRREKLAHRANAVLKEIYYNNGITTLRGTFPRIHCIELTNYCNLDCPMCPRGQMERHIGNMDIGLFKQIIDEAKTYQQFLYLHLWGESVIHPRIGEIIEYGESNGVGLGLSTNGTLMSPRKAEIVLRSGLTKLLFSIDGITKATFEELRAGGTLEKVIENARYVLRRKRELGVTRPRIVFQIIDMPKTRNEIAEFIEYWEKEGADYVSVKGFTTWANQSEKVTEYAPGDFAKYIPPDRRTFACRAPWDSVVIFWDGRVGLCCQDYDAKVVIGDLKKESLRSIWNGEKMVELRKRFARLDFENPLCAKCTNYASLTRAHPKNRLYPFNSLLRRMRSSRA